MSYRFLLIDDSSIVRKVLIKTLGMTTLPVGEIIEAANGEEGFKKLRESWVDLVFLDINMPVMNGMEFMEKLRVDPDYKDTKVVIVSTEGSKERRERLEELQVAAYLRKPVTPEEITQTVLSILGGSGK